MTEREELQAVIRARRELGPEYESELVDSFLEKVEKRLEQRGAAAPARRPGGVVNLTLLGSLGLSIPLIGAAGATAGAAGVALVCLAVVLVNLLALRRR